LRPARWQRSPSALLLRNPRSPSLRRQSRRKLRPARRRSPSPSPASAHASWRAAAHKSAQFFDLANTQRIDGYTVFDAGLSLDLKPLAGVPGVVRLNVDNVSDKAYWSSVSYGCCLSRGEPRTVKLSAAFSL
jgi:outer membrane receptor protein involved in Fe transport